MPQTGHSWIKNVEHTGKKHCTVGVPLPCNSKILMHNRCMNTAPDSFLIKDYPQLRLIAWNRQPVDAITGEEALDLYERNWRHVDHGAILPHERALIDRLVREYGNGILHV